MATCPKCGYEWETRAKGEMITCPSCQRKFPRPAPVIEVLGRKVPLKSTCDVCGYPYTELNVCRVDGEAAFVCNRCAKDLLNDD